MVQPILSSVSQSDLCGRFIILFVCPSLAMKGGAMNNLWFIRLLRIIRIFFVSGKSGKRLQLAPQVFNLHIFCTILAFSKAKS